MRRRCFLLAVVFLGVVGKHPAAGQEGLIRLEEGQKALAQRLEDLNQSLIQRIEGTNQRIEATNQRIEDANRRLEDLRMDMNQRFADLNFWLQLLFGMIFATLGAVLVQWATTMRRTTRMEDQLGAHLAETEKDRLLTFQREEIEVLKGRLERVEQALGR